MKNLHKGELGPLMTSQATHWTQPCIITDVKNKKISTASEFIVETLSFFHILLQCHNSPPELDQYTNDECSAPSGLREGNSAQRHNATPNTGSKI
jgi:hypothetical protein